MLVVKAKDREYCLNDVKNAKELTLHLILTAEDMRIILSKRTNTGQSMKFSALLITIHCSELSTAEWQFFIRTWLRCEHLTVVRTVHWLKHVKLIFLRCLYWLEGIFTIMRPVTGCNVEILRTYMWSYNFLITKAFLNLTQHLLKTQAQICTFWQPNWETLTYAVGEHKEFHLLTNLAMVAFLCFF